MTGKAHPWCHEFLRDFGAFNQVVAKTLRISIREVDRNVALTLEKARIRSLDACCNVTAEDLERGL